LIKVFLFFHIVILKFWKNFPYHGILFLLFILKI
jgi:hypothetical protein